MAWTTLLWVSCRLQYNTNVAAASSINTHVSSASAAECIAVTHNIGTLSSYS
jgi:hypothetical protein